MDTNEEIQTTKALVEQILEEDINARNSDKWLTYRVFSEIARKHGERIFLPFKIFDKFPAFETVKRVRAKIQNEEKRFLPTDCDVIEKRGQRQEEFKNFANDKQINENLRPRRSIALF